MKIHHLVIALAVTTGTLYAGGMDVKVNKDAVAVSPVDPQGAVTITGPPGCVFGMAPIQIMAQDKKNKMTATGSVMPDGSFALRLPASPKNSIKLIFAGADGKKKDIKVKIPKGALVIPPPPAGITIPHGEPIDQGAPGAPPGGRGEHLPLPSNDQINRSEKDLNTSGMIE
ncbi:MAG: hypothetical protein NTX71_01655 [Candidatus Aureabacteria bacterium]|nr:hypothetical protein [Candidatus Auribacterota bacterium]